MRISSRTDLQGYCDVVAAAGYKAVCVCCVYFMFGALGYHRNYFLILIDASFFFFPPGWGESYSQQKESSTWGEPTPAPPVTVDNGTSAWGKPMDTSSSWEEPNRGEPSRGSRESGWGGQHKSGRCTHIHKYPAGTYIMSMIML